MHSVRGRSAPLLSAPLLLLTCISPVSAQEPLEPPHALVQYPVFHLGLFGNVDYTAVAAGGDNAGFRNGGLDLFVTSQLSDRWSGLVEMLFETSGGALVTDLERIQLNFDHSDELRVTAGRIHSPVARWNLSIHHGVFLQTPIDRPALTAGEDAPGAFPVHFVGLIVSGRFRKAGGLTYTAGIGNGRGPTLEQVQTTRDANDHKAVLLGIGVSPAAALGLDVSVTGYLDRIPTEDGAIDERDVTLSASYVAHGFELRGEWGRLSHELEADGATHRTTGWYVLAARSLPGRLERVRPYAMVDRLHVADDFTYFGRLVDRSAWMAGVRWDADAAVALKAEVRSQRVGAGDRDALLRFQLAFALN